MVMRCLAHGCTNQSRKGEKKRVSFHVFPTDEALQQQWVAAMKVKNFNPSSRCAKICSDHFKPEDFEISFGLKKIRKGAVPSILHVAQEEPKNSEPKLESNLTEEPKKQDPKPKKSKVTRSAKNVTSSLCADSEVLEINQLSHNAVSIDPELSLTGIAIGSGLSIPSIAIAEQVDTSEIKDWTNVCRACLSARNLHDMEFLKYENLNFIQMYESLCNKKVLSNGLPKKLCNTCVAALTRFKLFLINCDESERKLKELANITECSDDLEPIYISDDTASEDLLGDRPNSPATGENRSESTDSLIEPSTETPSYLCEQIDDVISFLLDQSASHTAELAPEQSNCGDTKSELDSDEDNVNNKIVHSCSCGSNFIRYDAYTQHKKDSRHSDRTMYKCEYCGKINRDRMKHITHLRVHTKEKPFVCDMCGVKFNFYNNLLRHMRSHSGIKSYICSVCGKGFTTKFMLVNHERSKHSNEKPYLCSYCGANFGGRVNFTAHLRQHILRKTLARPQDPDRLKRAGMVGGDDPTPFQCDECHKYFTSRNKVRLHKTIHYTVECPECSRRFANERALRKHSTVHSLGYTGIRKGRTGGTWQCNYCDKLLKSRKDLELHENAHTGRRPYKCEICGRDWKQPMHLRRHMMMVHTGERPYSCTFCGKGYVDKCLYDAHMNVHIGVKPFTCETCPASFYDRSSLSKHRRRHREDYRLVECATDEPEEERVITKLVSQAPKRPRKNSQTLQFIVARSAHTTLVSRKRRIFYY